VVTEERLQGHSEESEQKKKHSNIFRPRARWKVAAFSIAKHQSRSESEDMAQSVISQNPKASSLS